MGTSMTAMLVGTPEDVGGHPGVTATIPRDEIEEALASDQPLDLILDVTRPKDGGVETTDVTVTWQRSDLESLLAGMDSDAITLSFDRAGLERAIDEPDFEGQGIREVMLLTVAAASASAAMAVSTAQGQLMDAGGGGGPVPVVVAPGHGEAGTASALAPSGLDVPIAKKKKGGGGGGEKKKKKKKKRRRSRLTTMRPAPSQRRATTRRRSPPAASTCRSLRRSRPPVRARRRRHVTSPRPRRSTTRRRSPPVVSVRPCPGWTRRPSPHAASRASRPEDATRRRSRHGGSTPALPRRPTTRRPSLREASASRCPGWTRRRSRRPRDRAAVASREPRRGHACGSWRRGAGGSRLGLELRAAVGRLRSSSGRSEASRGRGYSSRQRRLPPDGIGWERRRGHARRAALPGGPPSQRCCPRGRRPCARCPTEVGHRESERAGVWLEPDTFPHTSSRPTANLVSGFAA